MKTRSAAISLVGIFLACHTAAAPLPAEVRKREALGPVEHGLILLTAVRDDLQLSGDWKARFMPPEKPDVLARHAAELLKDGLSSRQEARLRQMAWQVRGPAALDDERFLSGLKLTRDQRLTFGAFAKEFRADRDRYLSGAVDGDESKLQEELRVIRSNCLMSCLNALLSAQQPSFAKIMLTHRSDFDPAEWSLQRLAYESEREQREK